MWTTRLFCTLFQSSDTLTHHASNQRIVHEPPTSQLGFCNLLRGSSSSTRNDYFYYYYYYYKDYDWNDD